ncbi:MAG: VOC family protein [Propionibacteriaceae bacterium]|nr:VOC family protein [Propionibacteriaceae bacterium]
MIASQLNLVCADLHASRRFYEALDVAFRPIEMPGRGVVALLSVSDGLTLGLHTMEFAQWWDASSPGVSAGSAVLDFTVPAGQTVDDVVARLLGCGGTVANAPEDLPFGDRYAVVTDPDGHRVGLRQPIG